MNVEYDATLKACAESPNRTPQAVYTVILPTLVTKVNKQTNKQTSGGSMYRGADAGGGAELCNMWSLICNASEYMEELWRCIRDASEKHRV